MLCFHFLSKIPIVWSNRFQLDVSSYFAVCILKNNIVLICLLYNDVRGWALTSFLGFCQPACTLQVLYHHCLDFLQNCFLGYNILTLLELHCMGVHTARVFNFSFTNTVYTTFQKFTDKQWSFFRSVLGNSNSFSSGGEGYNSFLSHWILFTAVLRKSSFYHAKRISGDPREREREKMYPSYNFFNA